MSATHESRWWELGDVGTGPCWLYSGRVGLGDDRPGLRYVHEEWQLVRTQRRTRSGHTDWVLVDGYLIASTSTVDRHDVAGAMLWAVDELASLAFDGIEALTKQARYAGQARAELVR